MSPSKYSVNQHPISIVLAWIDPSEIAIPEIQRPFVWHLTPIRDWIGSLLKAFPVGSPVAWKNLIIKLKDGFISEGKRIHTYGFVFCRIELGLARPTGLFVATGLGL